ncbi:MAG: hypothetical protein ACI92Z_003785 [Paracoccaceae bacterium]|jgi:hypothetical protein
MNAAHLRDLAVLSVKDPAEAARQLLAMQVPRMILWMVLFLVTICNTILSTIFDVLDPEQTPLPLLMSTPFMMLIVIAGGLIMTVYSIFWSGRLLGGKGTLDGVMVLLVWLQALRLVLQAAVLILALTIPLLSALLVLVAVVFFLYLLVHFINQAHQLDSMGRSVGVLILSMVIPALGLVVFLSLFGVSLTGTI